MYCEQCGAKLEDGSAFCNECGAPVEPDSAPAQPAGNSVQQVAQQPQPPKGGSWHIPVIAVCCVVIIALIVALVVALSQSTGDDSGADSTQESAAAQSSTTSDETADQSSSAVQQSSSSSYCAFNNATVTASSELQHDSSVNTSYYYASNVLDDDPDTCWAEGADGSGVGESLTFTLSSAAEVSGFEIRNGYQKTEEIYEHNARPHVVKIYADGELIHTATIAYDGLGYQKVEFSQPFKASTITIEIDSVYEGTKWSDCAISDIKFFS